MHLVECSDAVCYCELTLCSDVTIVLLSEQQQDVGGVTNRAAREDLQSAGWTITAASFLRLCDVAQVCK